MKFCSEVLICQKTILLDLGTSMPVTNSRVRFYVGRLNATPPIIWDRIKERPEKFDWRFRKIKLPEYITDEQRQALSQMNDDWARLRALREYVSDHIKRTTPEQREDVFKWIVKSWGGIRGGDDEAFSRWVHQLSGLKRETIEEFFKVEERKRPSSWSKILSFIDHRYYPVYDARNAVALNIILEETNVKWRFYMPGTQNTDVPKAVTRIRALLDKTFVGHHNQYAYYREYRNLLLSIVKQCDDVRDVLEVEMHLFAHSLPIIKGYIKEHNLDIDVDE